MKKLISLFLLFALSVTSALAVTEGEVESAPDVNISLTESLPSGGYYLPDASYFESEYEDAPEWADSKTHVPGVYWEEADMFAGTSNPYLTPGEIERALILKNEYSLNIKTGDGKSILNKTENVSLAVYAVDPKEFGGERFYHILPATNLTDEEILSMIDAYALMGLEFVPENLSYKNTMRGGGEETSRHMMKEEYDRLRALAEMITYGYLDVEKTIDDLYISLDPRYHERKTDFKLLPYRSLTDEELVSWLISMGYRDESEEHDFAAIEKEARKALYELLKLPLSMQRESIFTEGGYLFIPFLENGAHEDFENLKESDTVHYDTYGAMFFYPHADGYEMNAVVHFDLETGNVLSVSSMPYLDEEMQAQKMEKLASSAPKGVTDEDIRNAQTEAETHLGYENLTWFVQENTTSTNWGECKEVKALTPDGYWLSAFIGTDDGKLHGLQLEISAPETKN